MPFIMMDSEMTPERPTAKVRGIQPGRVGIRVLGVNVFLTDFFLALKLRQVDYNQICYDGRKLHHHKRAVGSKDI